MGCDGMHLFSKTLIDHVNWEKCLRTGGEKSLLSSKRTKRRTHGTTGELISHQFLGS